MTSVAVRTVAGQELVSTAGRVTLLDVRSPAEFETAHIPGSVNVPLDVVRSRAADVAEGLDRRSPVVLVCQSGVRALEALRALERVGVDDLQVLEGGVPAFADAGGTLKTGRSTWALERQVRLVAGSIVLTSVLASLRAPKARLLAGGIGAGLTFSALSNTCAMGNALMRLPYNRGPRDRSADDYVAQLSR